MKTLSSFLLLLIAGCTAGDDGSHSIAVDDGNSLGITRLETVRGDHSFELQAYSASGERIGSVESRIGAVTGIDPAGPEYGSEIVTTLGERQGRQVSRETKVRHLETAALADPAMKQFVGLAAVTNALAQDGGIIVSQPAAASVGNERAYGNDHWYMSCPEEILLPSPTAGGCCLEGNDSDYIQSLMFVRPDNLNLIIRYRGGDFRCRAQDGGWCSAGDCYYGPYGFSRGAISPPPSNGYTWYTTGWWADFYGYGCAVGSAYTVPSPPRWPDVTGNRTVGAACCVDGSGPCGGEFQNCSECGGGGNNSYGAWDL